MQIKTKITGKKLFKLTLLLLNCIFENANKMGIKKKINV